MGEYHSQEKIISMHHFFIKPEDISDNTAIIKGDDVRHIVNVLRMKVGQELLISTGEDWDYLCTIKEILSDSVLLDIKSENEDTKELGVKVRLYQGLPKSDKMEFIIQKAVELGVYEIIPVITKRTIVKLDKKKSDLKVGRWQAIAKSAAKQSKRGIIPKIEAPIDFKNAIDSAKDFEKKLIPYEEAVDIEKTRRLLREFNKGDNIAVFIGPEGGFEANEVEYAVERGFEAVTLGKRILRTETAGLAILSNIMLYTD